ncbi:MAG: hypothetical protein M5U35_01295 [Roseovarius sp.]|nr:hypothetical protein [Roseovarius sp.]
MKFLLAAASGRVPMSSGDKIRREPASSSGRHHGVVTTWTRLSAMSAAARWV